MAKNRFFIGPYKEGMQNNLRPFLIPDDAFYNMYNAYVYRGRVRKRFGSKFLNESVAVPQLSSRLRIAMPGGAAVGITDGSGNATAVIPGAASNYAVLGKMFSIGNYTYTVYQNGAMYTNDPTATVATYNTGTGTYTFAGAPVTTQIYYYPAHPVMGLLTFDTEETNEDQIIAFDTEFSYTYSVNGWVQLDAGLATWTGSDYQFFWGTSWRGTNLGDTVFLVTNFNATDGIRYWYGGAWTTLAYVPTAGAVINTCRIIIPFQNRLLLLNTVETIAPAAAVNHQNRIRWSLIGDPLVAATSFLESDGKGGTIDLPTKEAIISARIVKNHLIIFCERSTYELAYTNNEVKPFVLRQIDAELGAESTFASVLFDKDIVGVGNIGIHACNGSYVQRIDQKIPEEVFRIHNENAGVDRVYGIRDYEAEMIYWTFPSQENNPTYPNKVLTYSYLSKTWAFNDDTITCFGYFQPTNDLTWTDIAEEWAEFDEQWNSGDVQAFTRTVIAGNQQGFTFLVHKDITRNAPAMQITNITIPGRVQLTIMNHNLQAGDFILIESSYDADLDGNIYPVQSVIDANNIQIVEPSYTGPYTGDGLVTRVSRIDIWSKYFNFYSEQSRNFQINSVNFLLDKTDAGQITVDFIPGYSNLSVDSLILETSAYALYPFEDNQSQVWHPLYPNAEGSSIQLHIYLNDGQLATPAVALEDFELNAMLFSVTPTSMRLQ